MQFDKRLFQTGTLLTRPHATQLTNHTLRICCPRLHTLDTPVSYGSAWQKHFDDRTLCGIIDTRRSMSLTPDSAMLCYWQQRRCVGHLFSFMRCVTLLGSGVVFRGRHKEHHRLLVGLHDAHGQHRVSVVVGFIPSVSMDVVDPQLCLWCIIVWRVVHDVMCVIGEWRHRGLLQVKAEKAECMMRCHFWIRGVLA